MRGISGADPPRLRSRPGHCRWDVLGRHRTWQHRGREAPRVSRKLRLVKRYMGMIGSAARFSTGMKIRAATADAMRSPIIRGEFQAY